MEIAERRDMLNFKDWYTTEEVDEALTIQQRVKLKQALRRNKAKIQLGRKRAMRKIASPEVLKNRSKKQARNIFLKKLLKNKDKSDLSYSARQSYEKILKRKSGAIERLAKKLLPKVRKKDREKIRSKSSSAGQSNAK